MTAKEPKVKTMSRISEASIDDIAAGLRCSFCITYDNLVGYVRKKSQKIMFLKVIDKEPLIFFQNTIMTFYAQ